MSRICIVEDDLLFFRILETVFSKKAPDLELATMLSIEQYAQNLGRLGGFDLIMFSGSIGTQDGRSGTAPLVRSLKSSRYEGIIVGFSDSEEILVDLKEAGCDHVFNKVSQGVAAAQEIIKMLLEKRQAIL